MNFKVFEGEIPYSKLDRQTFEFKHKLANHPALKLENLLAIIPTLPEEKVMYSQNIKDISINLDYSLENDKKASNLEEIKQTLMSGNSLIALRNPELHPSIKAVFDEIVADIGAIMKKNKTGTHPIDPNIWIFIASPNAVTPYHLDRSSNFIFQIRGSKELAVFPPRDQRVMAKKNFEAYLDWNGSCPGWSEGIDHLATKYHFKSGEAAHIPFISGHYVKNGPEDISITISIFFQTEETLKWTNAMRFNNRLRKLGLSSKEVGVSHSVDSIKSGIFKIVSGISRFK